MNVGFAWTAVKLAIFTIVTIVVTAYLATIIGNLHPFSRPYEITAQFTDATGLLQGDVVKAAGVTIGRVESIEVSDGLALVTISIDEGTELPSSLGAEIRFRNLVGQRMITLVAGSDDPAAAMKDGDHIPVDRTRPAFDLSVLFNGLRPLIASTDPDDINTVTRELIEALRGRGNDIEQILTNLADVSNVVASRDAELDALLDGLNRVTGDLAGRDAQLRNTLANMNMFLTELSESRGELDSALVHLDDASGRLKRLIRLNDERIAAELDDLSVLLDVVEDKRADLRFVIEALPDFAVRIQRVASYGEWGNQHLINVCKDDFGTCGSRGTP